MLHQSQRLFGLRLGRAEHHEVIGIAREAIAGLMKLPVQVIENDVGQQRRDDPSYTVDNFEFLRVVPFQRPPSYRKTNLEYPG